MIKKMLAREVSVTKPFELREVGARIKAIFRRVSKEANKELDGNLILLGNITVDLQGKRVFKNDMEIDLKRKEAGLFFHFLDNRNKVFTRDELLNEIWGYDYYGDGRTVDVHIRRLRAKTDMPGESIIKTVFGTGYVMR